MARHLPTHLFRLAAGIITNVSADKKAGIGLTAGDNVDGYEKFGSLGKLPGSTRRSDDHSSAVVSLHQFEYTDLAFARQRKQLSLAGGVLRRINSDLSITSIQTGLASEALTSVVMNNRIHLSSPGQRNLATGGIKYDGDNVRNWGVNAPGTEETVVQALDSAANWTASTDATSSTNTTITQDNTAGVQVNKDGTASTTGYIQRTGQTDDISSAGSDTLFVWLFVPAGALQNLATSGTAVQVRFGDSGLTNSDSHNFSVGELFPGWNLLSMVLTTPDAQSGSGATLSSIDTWRLGVETSSSSVTITGFVWDRLFRQDEGAVTPTDADTTTGGTAGTYVYRVTYLTETGLESNAGAAASAITSNGILATCTLTQAGQPSDTETVTIDTKTYTFQTTLTDVDGNVFIGADADTTLDNLIAAINLDAGAGSKYATSMSLHSTVSATNPTATTALLTAKATGTAANSFATTETATNYSFTSTTAFTGGAATNAITLASVPTSSDAQVIARRIFRDVSGDAVFRFVGQIDDNVTTTFSDLVADASLGSAQPPLSGDAFIDNTPPGRLLTTVIHNKRVVGIVADNRNTLVLGDVNQPEAFRIVEQITLEEELVALETHALGTIIYGTDKIFLMTGDGVRSPIFIEEATADVGANGFRSVTRVKGLNMVVREQQIFLVGHPNDPWYLSAAIQSDLLANITNATLADAHIIHDRSRFRIVFFFKGSSGNYDQIHIYQYGVTGQSQVTGDGSGVDPLDIRNGVWFTMSLPSGVQPQSSAIVETTADQPELWVGGADGFVYQLQDTSKTSYANGVLTAAVNATFTTASVPLGDTPPNGRGEPRFLRINATTTTSTVVAVVVRLLSDANGVVISSNSFNITLASGSNSIIAPIPQHGRRGTWCDVQITNNVEADSLVIDSLELFYIPRGDFRGTRTA